MFRIRRLPMDYRLDPQMPAELIRDELRGLGSRDPPHMETGTIQHRTAPVR